MLETVVLILGIVVILFVAIFAIASRYRKCPAQIKFLLYMVKQKQANHLNAFMAVVLLLCLYFKL